MSEFSYTGYDLFWKNRLSKKGGGVICYVKNSLNAIKIDKEDSESYDSIYVEITKNNNSKVIIGTVYRPPKQQAADDVVLYREINSLSLNKQAIIIGDFNCPNIDWGSMHGDQEGNKLIEMIEDTFLTQIVDQPTRENNILDLILVTDPDLISNCEVGEKVNGCDHHLIRFDVNIEQKLCENKSQKPDYKRANFSLARALLQSETWELLQSATVDETWKNFRDKILEVERTAVPMKTIRVHDTRSPPWMTTEIKRAVNLKKRNFTIMKENNTIEARNRYQQSLRACRGLIRTSKRNYERGIARNAKTNLKQFFTYIRTKKKIKNNIGPLKDETGELIQDSRKMAGILNRNFASVFTIEHMETMPDSPTSQTGVEPLEIGPINEEDVKKYLDSLDTNKSTGPDNISPRLLKELRQEILQPLTALFNKSLQLQKVPEDWKLANVTPIFKKGDKSVPLNYRPISLTSVAGKILEKIIRDKVVKYLEDNSILSNSQHGFRNRRSCLTNLLDFFQGVYEYWDNSIPSDIIYLDFQKAFDKVPHGRLIKKLTSVGIGNNLTAWIKDWLIGRKQRVLLNGKGSEWLPVTSGVPQGSVLGPILFIIYINDLEAGVISSISKFADDTKVGGKALTTKDCEILQQDLNKITQWSEKWQMSFNVDKCKVMHVGSRNPNFNYKMQGKPLQVVQEESDLGVTISSDLKHTRHCKTACKKANTMLGFIARNFEYKTPEVMLSLYNSMVRPHLEYAVQFWSPNYRKDIESLERVQRRATRMIPSLRALPYEERLKRLNLFSLEKRRMRGDLIQVYKYLNKLSNVDHSKLFELQTNPRTRNNGYPIQSRRCNTDIGRSFFSNRIIRHWNELPAEVVTARTIDTFKNRLDRYFTDSGIS